MSDQHPADAAYEALAQGWDARQPEVERLRDALQAILDFSKSPTARRLARKALEPPQ